MKKTLFFICESFKIDLLLIYLFPFLPVLIQFDYILYLNMNLHLYHCNVSAYNSSVFIQSNVNLQKLFNLLLFSRFDALFMVFLGAKMQKVKCDMTTRVFQICTFVTKHCQRHNRPRVLNLYRVVF